MQRGSVPGRSTQEASFLYDMYLDDEDVEAFMASVDVKGAFPNTPHRLIEELWRQLGLPYGDFLEKYLPSRRYTVATGKGCGRDNHLVWSSEKSVVLRRGGKEGMALDVGDGVAWLERAEEAVVLGHVQAMEARGVRLPDKFVRGFRAMLVVLRHHPPSVQMTLYYLRAVLNAAVGYQGMHLPYWREQLEEVEGEVRRLIRGYEGIPTQVPWCVLRSPTAYYGEGMPPPLALPPAPWLPARAPARPSRALVPSRPPALSRAIRCLRSAPPRCCALAPCHACPGLLLARAPGHFPCRLLPPAPRSRGWHAPLPARPPLLPGPRAGRPAVFTAAAA